MKIIDCEQGSPEWLDARLGVVTASMFDKVITPKTLKPSDGEEYLNQLVAETVLGRPVDDVTSGFMERGTAMEPEARSRYAWVRGVDPTLVGFLTTDDGRVGASPDSLIGDDGLLELKCPKITTHVGYMRDPATLAAKYLCQVQGELWVSGRAWADLMSYNPVLPEVIVRVTPDPKWVAAFVPALASFLKRLDEALSLVTPAVDERAVTNPFLA